MKEVEKKANVPPLVVEVCQESKTIIDKCYGSRKFN